MKRNVNIIERIISVGVGGVLLGKTLKKDFYPIATIAGAYLMYRGISGNCVFYDALKQNSIDTPAINIRSYFTINRPKEELYAYWRNLENLPKFMEHLVSVETHGHDRSTWTAKIPGNVGEISWDAEIVKDEPNHLIGWQSLANTIISNAGKVEFKDAPKGQGTELTVVFSYHPPIGNLGTGIAKLLNKTFEMALKNEIRGFKQMMEARESTSNNS